MPINATLGSTIGFTVVFFDTSSNITVPTSATLTVTYPPSSNILTTVSCSIGMTASGNLFVATWGSGVAGYGLSSYSISGAGQSTPTTGTLRLIS
jgi:hypothetical protein